MSDVSFNANDYEATTTSTAHSTFTSNTTNTPKTTNGRSASRSKRHPASSAAAASFPYYCAEVNAPVKPILLESLLHDQTLASSPAAAAVNYYYRSEVRGEENEQNQKQKSSKVTFESAVHFDPNPLYLTVLIVCIANLMGFLMTVGKIGAASTAAATTAFSRSSALLSNSATTSLSTSTPFQIYLDLFSIGIAFALATLPSLLVHTTFARVKVSGAAIFVWAIRLTLVRLARLHQHFYHHNDPRIDPWLQSKYGLLVYCCTSALWGLLLLLPHALGTTSSSLGNRKFLWVGVLYFILGFVIEAVADYQKYQFHQDSPHQFCHVGLWAYAQQPNYSGEILVWLGIFCMNVSSLVDDVVMEHDNGEWAKNSGGSMSSKKEESNYSKKKFGILNETRRLLLSYWRVAIAFLSPLFVTVNLYGQATGRPISLHLYEWTGVGRNQNRHGLARSPLGRRGRDYYRDEQYSYQNNQHGKRRMISALELARDKYGYGVEPVYTAYVDTVPVLLGLTPPSDARTHGQYKLHAHAWMEPFDVSKYLTKDDNESDEDESYFRHKKERSRIDEFSTKKRKDLSRRGSRRRRRQPAWKQWLDNINNNRRERQRKREEERRIEEELLRQEEEHKRELRRQKQEQQEKQRLQPRYGRRKNDFYYHDDESYHHHNYRGNQEWDQISMYGESGPRDDRSHRRHHDNAAEKESLPRKDDLNRQNHHNHHRQDRHSHTVKLEAFSDGQHNVREDKTMSSAEAGTYDEGSGQDTLAINEILHSLKEKKKKEKEDGAKEKVVVAEEPASPALPPSLLDRRLPASARLAELRRLLETERMSQEKDDLEQSTKQDDDEL